MTRTRRLAGVIGATLILAACAQVNSAPAPTHQESSPGHRQPPDWASPRARTSTVPGLVESGTDQPVQSRAAYVLNVESGQQWKIRGLQESLVWSPTGGSLVMYGETGLRVIDLSGPARRIFEGPVAAAAWSPDGDRLAIAPVQESADQGAGAAGLLLLDKTGANLQWLSDLAAIRSLKWSPSGERLAVITTDQRAYLVDTESGETALAFEGVEADRLSWSPDGKWLAAGTGNGLQLYDPAADRSHALSNLPSDGLVLWSSTASRLLSGERISGLRDSYIITLHHPRQGPLGWPSAISLGHPTWGPDGSQFAYVSEGCTSGKYDLLVVTDKGERRQLTDSTRLKLRPIWSPTGGKILLTELDRLMLVDAETGAEQVLISLAQDVPGPLIPLGWSADGQYVAFTFGLESGICN